MIYTHGKIWWGHSCVDRTISLADKVYTYSGTLFIYLLLVYLCTTCSRYSCSPTLRPHVHYFNHRETNTDVDIQSGQPYRSVFYLYFSTEQYSIEPWTQVSRSQLACVFLISFVNFTLDRHEEFFPIFTYIISIDVIFIRNLSFFTSLSVILCELWFNSDRNSVDNEMEVENQKKVSLIVGLYYW